MSEKRKKYGTVLLKIQGNVAKIELFQADQWQDGAGMKNAMRLRVNGKWKDSADGDMMFFGHEALSDVMTRGIFGIDPTPPMPKIYPGTPLSIPNGRTLNGIAMRDITRARERPELGDDGQWYVLASLVGCSPRLFRCDDVIIKK